VGRTAYEHTKYRRKTTHPAPLAPATVS
jgi:hypothetical protein